MLKSKFWRFFGVGEKEADEELLAFALNIKKGIDVIEALDELEELADKFKKPVIEVLAEAEKELRRNGVVGVLQPGLSK